MRVRDRERMPEPEVIRNPDEVALAICPTVLEASRTGAAGYCS